MMTLLFSLLTSSFFFKLERREPLIYRVFKKERLNFERVYKVMYLDMLQQFLIPQLDGDNQEGAFTSSKMEHLLITLDSMATSFPGFYTPGFFHMGIP
jgi:hypothetical protein